MLLLHYTGMKDCASALGRLTDPDAKVSAHYLIDEDGETCQLVPEERRAWHAGVASWRGETDINACSIGIELVNPGHEFGYRAFPDVQMAALRTLAHGIVARHGIPPERVLGHSDVAPSRRCDPGELFDWPDMARHGIGVWPERFSEVPPQYDQSGAGSSGPAVCVIQEELAAFGYGIVPSGEFDAETMDVVAAFQRHFRPGRVDGVVDAETRYRISILAKECC